MAKAVRVRFWIRKQLYAQVALRESKGDPVTVPGQLIATAGSADPKDLEQLIEVVPNPAKGKFYLEAKPPEPEKVIGTAGPAKEPKKPRGRPPKAKPVEETQAPQEA